MSDRDEVLVRRFLGGDVSAFGVLVERHQDREFNLALRILGREEDARDATQEAFLAALRKLSGFRGDAAFTTWMHRVTVNACYDLLRKRARAPLLRSGAAADDLVPDLGPPTPDHADEIAGTIDVARALARVPIEYRAVLVLHDVQDLGYEDIAGILNVPVGTVKSRTRTWRSASDAARRSLSPELPWGACGGSRGWSPLQVWPPEPSGRLRRPYRGPSGRRPPDPCGWPGGSRRPPPPCW
ncbi:MAG: sigma-70 family RNA polymerase sigma factor [Actinobacteria bacterium]|nr:sigma-70 family RNA polymerase sigma factor [Actinomycetota bacterium]